ncbi:MAG: glycosyltransferase, partial [Oscillatoriales cyanobacterium]
MQINQLGFLFVDVVLSAIALIVLIPVAVLFLECCAAFLSSFGTTAETQEPRPKVAVLIPAYNEAAGIAATISTILPQLTPQDRLLVIADNCTDATAEIAR